MPTPPARSIPPRRPRTSQPTRGGRTPRFALALALTAVALPVAAQVRCWAPQEDLNRARDPRFAVQYGWMKRAEQIVRGNAPFLTPPEPVRMRTTVAAGPLHPSNARLFVRAYPEAVGSIRIWADGCNVIPQAERVAASIGQIDVFFNTDVRDMFLGTGKPVFEGRVGGYPRYSGWVVITKGGRLPWLPQTLADRLDAETAQRERTLAEWRQQLAAMKAPDLAAMAPAIAQMRRTDPAGADRLEASVRETARELEHKQRVVYPAMTAQYEKDLADVRRYRATFTPEQLRMAAVWTDTDGAGRRALEERIRVLNLPTAEDEALLRSKARTAAEVRAARAERIGPALRDAQAQHDLAYLRPGPDDQAIAYKPDPGLPDMGRPDKLQLIAVLFTEDPTAGRGPWMQAAKEAFDFAALAAMLD